MSVNNQTVCLKLIVLFMVILAQQAVDVGRSIATTAQNHGNGQTKPQSARIYQHDKACQSTSTYRLEIKRVTKSGGT